MGDPQEIQAIKDALAANTANFGVGILHVPSGRVHLRPFDEVPGGHAQLANDLGLPLNECRGFVIAHSNSGCQVVNASHLNNPAGQGAPGSMQMPQPEFDHVLQSLKDAGL